MSNEQHPRCSDGCQNAEEVRPNVLSRWSMDIPRDDNNSLESLH